MSTQPTHPPNPHWPKSAKWTVAILSIFLLIAIGAVGQNEGDTSNTDSAPAGAAADEATAPKPEPARTREAANPDGKYDTNCDYILQFADDSPTGADNHRFVAGGTLENTGNVGIVVKLTAKWQLLGQSPVKATKKARLRVGQSKDIQMSVPATGTQIDEHQSADGKCKASVDIVDTFGKPPFE